MLKLRLNKVKLKNHFRYYVWIYAAAMVIAGTLLNMAVTVVKNQSPPQEKLYSYICGDAISLSYFYTFLEEMTDAFPDMKVVSCENLSYNAGGSMAYQYKQKFLSLISNGYGDVMILPYQDFADLVQYGYFAPLEYDFAEYINGIDEVSLKTVTMHLEDYGTHVYAIPLGHLEFFPYTYDTSDKVIVLTDYSLNKDNAKKLLQWYLDYMTETDWYGSTL